MKNSLVSVVIVTKDRKKDLIECIDSFLIQSYSPLEIIVVDNGSIPKVSTWLEKKFSHKVNLISLEENIGAAEGRNIGYLHSSGSYILFSDDDARSDKDMISELVKAFKQKTDAGIIQPLVYDKDKPTMLQGAGHEINLTTGRLTAWGVREKDNGQYQGIREIPLAGCVWMVKREVFLKTGLYDKDYFIPYEDSDFSFQVGKVGYKVYCSSEAKTWHQGPKLTFVHPALEWLGITSSQRAYRLARNKMIYIRKNSNFWQQLFFFFILLPPYTIAHSAITIYAKRFDILINYWKGVFSGIIYCLTFNLKPLSNWLIMKLMSLQEPVCWLIDRKSKTVLDIGSGPGLPMELIKLNFLPEKSVGVDLFSPYIEQGKIKRIHDEYVQQDVRKINFPPKSFDTVIALQVLEHLKKSDAFELIDKIEKIAKRQVIIAMPIGHMDHPEVDNNPLQAHQSHFYPEELSGKGYKIVKFGSKWLLGENGLVHSVNNNFLKRLLFVINFLLTPFYVYFQPLSDYHFYAIKRFK